MVRSGALPWRRCVAKACRSEWASGAVPPWLPSAPACGEAGNSDSPGAIVRALAAAADRFGEHVEAFRGDRRPASVDEIQRGRDALSNWLTGPDWVPR